MGDGLYIAMSAATSRTRQLDEVADALANVDTPGFKRVRGAFESFSAPGDDGRLTHVASVKGGLDKQPGVATRTGRELDVLPEEGTYLAVQLGDGSVGYTRNGRIEQTNDGTLLASGNPLLDNRGLAVVVPPGPVTVRPDGTVLVGTTVVTELSTFRLEGDLTRVSPSTLQVDGKATRTDPALAIGQVEYPAGSSLDSAVEMVSVQRQYENAMQAIQTYRRLDQVAAELGKIR